MIPFKTTPEQATNIVSILGAMNTHGINIEFLRNLSEVSQKDQGVYDLMAMWFNETSDTVKSEIMADLEKSINDYLWYK